MHFVVPSVAMYSRTSAGEAKSQPVSARHSVFPNSPWNHLASLWPSLGGGAHHGLRCQLLRFRMTSPGSGPLLCRGRGKEVDEELVDAFGPVVMHPMGSIVQALDALEVGHVVVVGLGEVGAEVGIALSPDDQRRR